MEKNRSQVFAIVKTIAYFKWLALFHGPAMLGVMLIALTPFRLPLFSGTGLGVMLLFALGAAVWALDIMSCRLSAPVRCQHDRALRHYFRGDSMRADTRLSAIRLAATARFGSERGAYEQIRRIHGEVAVALKAEPFSAMSTKGALSILIDPISGLALGIRAQQSAVRQVVWLISQRGEAGKEALSAFGVAYWICDVGVFLIGCTLGYMLGGMLLGLLWGYALMQLISRVVLSPVITVLISNVVYPKPSPAEPSPEKPSSQETSSQETPPPPSPSETE